MIISVLILLFVIGLGLFVAHQFVAAFLTGSILFKVWNHILLAGLFYSCFLLGKVLWI